MSGERYLAEKRSEPEPVGTTSAFPPLIRKMAPKIDMIICPYPDLSRLERFIKSKQHTDLGCVPCPQLPGLCDCLENRGLGAGIY